MHSVPASSGVERLHDEEDDAPVLRFESVSCSAMSFDASDGGLEQQFPIVMTVFSPSRASTLEEIGLWREGREDPRCEELRCNHYHISKK